MKSMISLDFVLADKYLAQETIVTIPIGLIVSFFIGNVYTMPTAIAAAIPLMLGFSLCTVDEKDRWEQFRLALPLSRNDIVAGRYLSCAILAVAGVAMGLAIYALTVGASLLVPSLPNAGQFTQDLAAAPALAAPCIGAVVGLTMLAIVLPGVAKCGITKTIRFVPAIATLVLVFAIAIASGTGGSGAIEAVVESVFASPTDSTLALLALIAFAAAVYAASYALARTFYRKREF